MTPSVDTAELGRWLSMCVSAGLRKVPVPIDLLQGIIKELEHGRENKSREERREV